MESNYLKEAFKIKRIPWVCIFLIFWSFAITGISYFFPLTRQILHQRNLPFDYNWAPLIGVFLHGRFIVFSDIIHSFGNMIFLFYFGILTEKVLGTSKMLLLTILSFFGNITYFYIVNRWGWGVSQVSWAYILIPFVLIYKQIKLQKFKAFKSFWIIIGVLFLCHAWIIMTIIQLNNMHNNIVHLIPTIIGIVFCIIWLRDNKEKVSIEKTNIKKIEYIISLVFLIALSLVLSIIIFNLPHELKKFEELKKEIADYKIPKDREELNKNNGIIPIRFETEMWPVISSYGRSINSSNIVPITIDEKWLDNKTLLITISRNLNQDDRYVKISIGGLRDMNNKKYNKNIELNY